MEEERDMLPGDQYPLAPARQHLLLLAATPGDSLAEALAQEMRRYGWTSLVTDQVETHAAEAQACIVLLAPSAMESRAVSSALSARPANLIPLVMTSMAPPYAPWAVAPITFMGSVERVGAAIQHALAGLLGPAAPMPSAPPPSAAAPSMPLYAAGYGAQPTYPMGVPGPQGYPGYPSYSGYPGYAADPQAQSAPPKRRGGLALLFAVIGVVALLVVIVGGLYAFRTALASTHKATASGTATATIALPTPTATLPAGFSPYTAPTGDFQIDQPSSWARTASTSASIDDILWVSKQQQADIVIGYGPGTASSADIATAESGIFKQVSLSAGGNGSYSHFTGPTSVLMAGEDWTQAAADITVHGITLHGVVLAVNHNGSFYTIAYFGQKSDFASLDSHTFQPMLHSFMFLN